MNVLFMLAFCLLFLFVPLGNSAELNVSIDLGTFQYDSTQSFTEIYYSVPVSNLTFQSQDDGSLKAEVIITMKIEKEGKTWNEDAWRMEKIVKDTSEINDGNRMLDLVRYIMEPGTYKIEFSVQDLNNKDNQRVIEQDLKVYEIPKNELYCSDVMFARSMKKIKSQKDNIFYKHGYEVVPNPSSVYGEKAPILFYYLEAYNLPSVIKADKYNINCKVTDAQGQTMPGVKTKKQTKTVVESCIEIGTLNVSKLPSGVFNFQFDILDSKDTVVKSATKKFYVYNPNVAPPEPVAFESIEEAVTKSQFSTMASSQLDQEFDQAKYIATKEEIKVYNNLKDVAGKRKFLFQFWKGRDIIPETFQNEYRREYLRRIDIVNNRFRSYSRDGWKTDRGRVYILFGKPDDIERNPNNSQQYAHEIWHYDDIEGGVVFVFADFQEFGEYAQIHSDKTGETYDNSWQQSVSK